MSAVLNCPICGNRLTESEEVQLIKHGNKEYHVNLKMVKCAYCGTSEIATGWGKFYKNDDTKEGKVQEEKEPERYIMVGTERVLNPKWVDRNPLYKAVIYSKLRFPRDIPKWRAKWYLKTHKPSFRMILGGVLYDTNMATLLTTDDWSDGDKAIRSFYYKMPRGDYFSLQLGYGQKDQFRKMNEYEIKNLLGKIAPDVFLQYFQLNGDMESEEAS